MPRRRVGQRAQRSLAVSDEGLCGGYPLHQGVLGQPDAANNQADDNRARADDFGDLGY